MYKLQKGDVCVSLIFAFNGAFSLCLTIWSARLQARLEYLVTIRG